MSEKRGAISLLFLDTSGSASGSFTTIWGNPRRTSLNSDTQRKHR